MRRVSLCYTPKSAVSSTTGAVDRSSTVASEDHADVRDVRIAMGEEEDDNGAGRPNAAQNFLRGLFGWRRLPEEGPPERRGAGNSDSSATSLEEIAAQDVSNPSNAQIAQQERILRAFARSRDDSTIALRSGQEAPSFLPVPAVFQQYSSPPRGSNHPLFRDQGAAAGNGAVVGNGINTGGGGGADASEGDPPPGTTQPSIFGRALFAPHPLMMDASDIPLECRQGNHRTMQIMWPTLPGLCCACLFYPWGLVCCLFHKMRRCPECGTIVHSC